MQAPALKKIISFSDLVTVVTLAVLAPLAWLFSERASNAFCHAIARLHVTLRGGRSSKSMAYTAIEQLGYDAFELEHKFTATVYQETAYTLREHKLTGWHPDISLRGRQYIDQALEAGRGAVLWICPCSHAELVVKKALYGAGVPLVNLRSHIHPYSGTRFGTQFLNPIRTSAEDRYLHATVVLRPKREAVAFRELQMWLRKNMVVSVFAIASSDRPFGAPCLSGTLRLALGAPTLAILSHAPLLPVFMVPTSSGGFEVTIEAPLQAADGQDGGPAVERLGRAYARLTESWVTKCPHIWRGWFSRSLWKPGNTSPR